MNVSGAVLGNVKNYNEKCQEKNRNNSCFFMHTMNEKRNIKSCKEKNDVFKCKCKSAFKYGKQNTSKQMYLAQNKKKVSKEEKNIIPRWF